VPLIVATWIGAIATAVLAVGAGFTVYYARNAFREQAREVALLQKQVESEQGERGREADGRRMAQAARVYITLDVFGGNRASAGDEYVAGRPARPPSVTAFVQNTSEQPVYDLQVHWVCGDEAVQAGSEDLLGTLGPHSEKQVKRNVLDTVTLKEFGPVAYFRDAAGARWTLLPGGELEPVPPELVAGASLIATRAARSARGAR
jgi:hypothetical protein